MSVITTEKPDKQAKKRQKLQSGKRGKHLPQAAFFITLLGIGLIAYMFFNRSLTVTEGQNVRAGTLNFRVKEIEWLAHEQGGHSHDGDEEEEVNPQQEEIEDLKAEGQVFPMPASMMPGMPEAGMQRLQVEFILDNQGSQAQPYDAGEFTLYAENGDYWLPQISTSFRSGSLASGQAINGLFSFDVPDNATGLYLVWLHEGTEVRIPVEDPEAH